MFSLTKRMFTLIKGMGHEKHMVFFYQNDHFDQVLSHTSNQERQNFKMVQDAHGLIKSTIIMAMLSQIGHINLVI